jgi:hypothetical protein
LRQASRRCLTEGLVFEGPSEALAAVRAGQLSVGIRSRDGARDGHVAG